jgi:hypothetical protein
MEIDHFFNPIGAWELLVPPLGPSSIESPFESDLTVCIPSMPRAWDSSLIDYASPHPNLHRHMIHGQFTSPFETTNPPHSRDSSYIEFTSDEGILEATNMVSIPWEKLHCGFCFLPFWETFQVDYQRDSWLEPTNGLYLNQYYA